MLLSLLAGDLLRAGILLLIFQVFALQLSVVRGSSMLPNIHDGDRLLVDKYSYSLSDIERFDVVILSCPVNEGVDYVKRVVGLPGDRIVLDRGKL
ncbi:MAG TPA: signal peptidase I, partial [Planctomycetes bacterium]|nr:signal peptidase I [Planctomycetota bacterium]